MNKIYPKHYQFNTFFLLSLYLFFFVERHITLLTIVYFFHVYDFLFFKFFCLSFSFKICNSFCQFFKEIFDSQPHVVMGSFNTEKESETLKVLSGSEFKKLLSLYC